MSLALSYVELIAHSGYMSEAPIFIHSLTENDFLFFGQRADWMLYLQKCFVRSVAHCAFCLNICVKYWQVISIQAMITVINDMT